MILLILKSMKTITQYSRAAWEIQQQKKVICVRVFVFVCCSVLCVVRCVCVGVCADIYIHVCISSKREGEGEGGVGV